MLTSISTIIGFAIYTTLVISTCVILINKTSKLMKFLYAPVIPGYVLCKIFKDSYTDCNGEVDKLGQFANNLKTKSKDFPMELYKVCTILARN